MEEQRVNAVLLVKIRKNATALFKCLCIFLSGSCCTKVEIQDKYLTLVVI